MELHKFIKKRGQMIDFNHIKQNYFYIECQIITYNKKTLRSYSMIKVSIMGATGVIGKNVAFKLARTDVIDEIVLFSREESFNKAKGETYDMYDALSAENVDCDLIPSSNYEDLKDSQVVLITAGVPRKGDMDRLELAGTNARIVREYARQIAIHAPDTIILVATNPVDVMTLLGYNLLLLFVIVPMMIAGDFENDLS